MLGSLPFSPHQHAPHHSHAQQAAIPGPKMRGPPQFDSGPPSTSPGGTTQRRRMSFLGGDDNQAMATQGLMLQWREIAFDVELSDVVSKAQTPPGAAPLKTKRILHGVSGQAPSNSLMAVMVRRTFLTELFCVSAK